MVAERPISSSYILLLNRALRHKATRLVKIAHRVMLLYREALQKLDLVKSRLKQLKKILKASLLNKFKHQGGTVLTVLISLVTSVNHSPISSSRLIQ